MRILSILVVLTMLLVSPGFGEMAHEHGEGQGHKEMQNMQGMPGTDEGMEGSHAAMQGGTHEMHEMTHAHVEHVAALREAASLLQSSRPDLAKELEQVAEMMSQGS